MRNGNAIPVQTIIDAAEMTRRVPHPRRAAAVLTASPVKTAVALTAAGAIALAPLQAPGVLPGHVTVPALPTITVPHVQLTALVSPADVKALVDNLNAALAVVPTTVSSVVGLPGQTLGSALGIASGVSGSMWDSLIGATDNPVLTGVLTALKAISTGSLTRLATTVDSANDTITLTSGQLTSLLASTVTGSLSTALTAVANVVNNPLSAAGYIGLLNTPLNITGLVLENSLSAINKLGVLTLAGTLITGVTSQVTNALSAVNKLIDSGKALVPNEFVDGILTAVQGILAAPVNAAVAGINGLTSTVVHAGNTAIDKLTTGASSIVKTWLGNGTSGGALQAAIAQIGSNPLSPASYTDALSTIVGAAITTGFKTLQIGATLASLPFTTAASLTATGANVITALTSGLATAASGALHAIGLSAVADLPYALATAVNASVKVTSFAVQAGLNTVATLLNLGSAVTGFVTPLAATAATSAVPTVTAKATPKATSAEKAEATPEDAAAAGVTAKSTGATGKVPTSAAESATTKAAEAETAPAAEKPATKPAAETKPATKPASDAQPVDATSPSEPAPSTTKTPGAKLGSTSGASTTESAQQAAGGPKKPAVDGSSSGAKQPAPASTSHDVTGTKDGAGDSSAKRPRRTDAGAASGSGSRASGKSATSSATSDRNSGGRHGDK